MNGIFNVIIGFAFLTAGITGSFFIKHPTPDQAMICMCLGVGAGLLVMYILHPAIETMEAKI